MPKFVRQGDNTLIGNNTFTGTNTFSGSVVSSGTFTNTGGTVRNTSQSALVGATVVLTAADSGKVLFNRSTSGSPSWTLPTAAAGLTYTFCCSNTTTGFTVTGGTVFARADPDGAAITGTTLTHTQGTAVVGDSITFVCNGTNWYATAQVGIFAAA
jgi:hypothetical protein